MKPIVHIPDDGSAGEGLSPELLRQVDELHALVRAWAKAGSKTGAVPMPVDGNPTALYVDLMFAYGLAKLGEVRRSAELADVACAALDMLPAESDKDIAGRFLYKAFKYRIDEAAEHSSSDRLSPVLYDELSEIDRTSKGIANSPHGIAHFVITRLLQYSRILEPFEQHDPYKRFTAENEGGLKQALYELAVERDPVELANRVRTLYRQEGPSDHDGHPQPTTEGRFDVLRECLPLSARCGAEFAAELIRLVPDAVRQPFPEQMELPRKQAELLERGLFLAGHFGHRDLAAQLTDAFTELVVAKTGDDRLQFISIVCGSCVRSLRKLGRRDNIDKLLQRLHTTILGRESMNDLKPRYSETPEQWMRVLETLLSIAGGCLTLGLVEQANPILDEARNELLSAPGERPMPQDNARLAKVYIAVVSQGPVESGLQRIAELFRKIDPNKITNSFTTAPFYSRLHLAVADEVVLAVLQMLLPGPSVTR